MVGVGTVLADDPWLTARYRGGRDPQRIVLDSQLRTPPSAHLLPKRRGPRTIIACGPRAPAARERALAARGAEVWRVRTHANGRVDVWELGKQLAEAKLCSVLVGWSRGAARSTPT
jgi:riboflavin biosynthesis pyrimidine reductase